jgi:hypothetical protein
MKIKTIKLLCLAGLLAILSSCGQNGSRVKGLAPNAHQVTALEVIQGSSYSYVRVMEDGKQYWLAINYADIKKGGTYFWSKGGEMKDFTSKELNRTFPSIFFIEDFTDKPITAEAQMPGAQKGGRPHIIKKEGIVVQKPEGGITIAELYANPKAYAGKSVKIRGEVIKFSGDIMKKNWVHIQDGTQSGDNFDLTITTQDIVKAGDVVIFEGNIAVNKDYGYGYIYEVIMEDASVRTKL